MDIFLSNARERVRDLSKFNRVIVVIGNDSCDLDSAVSAIVYSYLISTKMAISKTKTVIPMLNITREELPLKTEVTYFLSKTGINTESLILRDTLDLQKLSLSGKLELILVDHHSLPPPDNWMKSFVVEVIDHRPQDVSWYWPQQLATIEIVGSCCTLIARKILEYNPSIFTPSICNLLYGTILLDTACMSPTVARATPVDHEVISELEKVLPSLPDRNVIYRELVKARADISELLTDQILNKDKKAVCNVPICGFPFLVMDFIKRPDSIMALDLMCKSQVTPVIVLMGLCTEGDRTRRDLGIYSTDCSLAHKLCEHLTPALSLESMAPDRPIHGFYIFHQRNVTASRKQVLPLVKAFFEECKGS